MAHLTRLSELSPERLRWINDLKHSFWTKVNRQFAQGDLSLTPTLERLAFKIAHTVQLFPRYFNVNSREDQMFLKFSTDPYKLHYDIIAFLRTYEQHLRQEALAYQQAQAIEDMSDIVDNEEDLK